LLPRIYMIIEEIDRQFAMDVYSKGYNKDFLNQVAIIGRNNIRMANLCVIGSFSVNGVAKLHTEILKDDLFKHYYKLFPEKFNNKTNGITPRRWMLYSNPELAGFVSKTISADLSSDFQSISDLANYANDPEVQKRFLEVKRHNKESFAEYVKEHYGFTVDPNSIYDVIAKRLHAYKRQLLDIFYVIHLYLRLKEDPNFTVPKTTFFFAAKAASSYTFAKEVIKLINCVAETIRNDADVCDKLQVVFLPNYCVTLSEHLVPAAEISEQISLAGKEASGTGNMKFMMNGAITLGTLDGANVEIREEVGDDNIVIFGLRTDEVNNLRRVYRCRDYYENDDRLRRIIYSLMNGTFTKEANAFKNITDEFLVRNDEYFVFADFDAYVKAHEKTYEIMQQPELYAKMALINIAKSAYFSSDRTIEDYVRDIWHLKKL
ncbi:MAG: glycogen/starch/alpha-glucan phosphorylase, partial [Erysipelotrichaceae bacterium]|nr:glycogen/starch/alpha-glucan phosphorylase [Erysipelotrichaceae bacterium]